MKGTVIPVVFIPRKPHPNGFVIYIVAAFIINPLYSSKKRESNPSWADAGKDKMFRNSFLPIIVDFMPHLVVGDISPFEAMRKLMKNWSFEGMKPHIVTDSVFGSFPLMEEVVANGFTWKTALGTDSAIELGQVLSYNLAAGRWRCGVKEDLVINCSMKKTKSETFSHKVVLQRLQSGAPSACNNKTNFGF